MATAKIICYGGAGAVTGANFMLDTGSVKVLIDCGARERERACDPANYEPFAYDVKSVDALMVTHAHADHIGRIPKLVHDGFASPIYSTPATRDLAELMFADALGVMQTEMEKQHCPPMYEQRDVERALSLWRTHDYHEAFTVKDLTISFFDAGHILGSAMVRVARGESAMLFTGDLGNTPEPLLKPTEHPEGLRYVLMESVYGDRMHDGRDDRGEKLREVIEDVRAQKGTLLIPSFSIERTQVLLAELNAMVESGKMQPIPVFLDAPLAIKVTDVYRKHKDNLNEDIQARFVRGDDPFSFEGLSLTPKVAQSQHIFTEPDPKVIIAGAGMSHGGRIREHERQYLGDKNATILFVGYQAPGSLGRRIQDGAREVTIDGERVAVRAQVETIGSYSGHADRDGLLNFVEGLGTSVQKVFVAMGEPSAATFLAQRIRDFLDVPAVAPNAGDTIEIEL